LWTRLIFAPTPAHPVGLADAAPPTPVRNRLRGMWSASSLTHAAADHSCERRRQIVKAASRAPGDGLPGGPSRVNGRRKCSRDREAFATYPPRTRPVPSTSKRTDNAPADFLLDEIGSVHARLTSSSLLTDSPGRSHQAIRMSSAPTAEPTVHCPPAAMRCAEVAERSGKRD